MRESLRITEIFHSLQGETSRMGLPTVFVRLTGCPMRCTYCDSAYAFTGGKTVAIDDIMAQIASYGCKTVCVTGGEPLAQKPVHILFKRLCDEGYSVSTETGGGQPIDAVDPRVSRILDIKTPKSGELKNMLWANVDAVNERDEIKFVLVDRSDYEWARDLVREKQLHQKAPVIFSPVWESLKPVDLAEWVIADKLDVRVQVQLHKILWGEKPGV
ncbi:7-carboxy-7-deazaguanine synthase QueE [Chitinibacter bivalviorum]|uniref:7-carboxy-7-deazaguanine synthase n=1 Tax=Chitinibacter bivalviorum TaxID=2739434 RepID=A0A7H9BL12_9NEIS|nr:7-carboxy-7-deazaguanine synthase QueE [Chitinibacter bivalviorum]QLG89082.1 7-carboxy-7-deazaguanine synthase QueE [Chitinibacter bivalviorum]